MFFYFAQRLRPPRSPGFCFERAASPETRTHGRVLHASRSVTVPDGTEREKKNTRQCLLANTYQCFITPIFRFGGAEASPDRLNWSRAENNPCGFECPRDGSSAPRASRNTRAAGRGVCGRMCCFPATCALTFGCSSQYSHTTPFFDTLLSHSWGCYCLGAGYIGVIRAYYQKDHLRLKNCVLLLPSFTSGGPAAVPF